MGEVVICSLEEFAELVGVTPETMRAHIKDLLKDGADVPAWLVERGDRGRAYKIEAEGGTAWWLQRREAEDQAEAARQAGLQQLRLKLVGDNAEGGEQLALSGRQRRDEYEAGLAALKYRQAMRELVVRADVERVLTAAAVDLRRALKRVPPEFGIAAGLEPDLVRSLDGMIERALDLFVSEIEKPDAFAD